MTKEIVPRDGVIPGVVLIRILKASGWKPTFKYAKEEKSNEQ